MSDVSLAEIGDGWARLSLQSEDTYSLCPTCKKAIDGAESALVESMVEAIKLFTHALPPVNAKTKVVFIRNLLKNSISTSAARAADRSIDKFNAGCDWHRKTFGEPSEESGK
jgi:hypothetical protein